MIGIVDFLPEHRTISGNPLRYRRDSQHVMESTKILLQKFHTSFSLLKIFFHEYNSKCSNTTRKRFLSCKEHRRQRSTLDDTWASLIFLGDFLSVSWNKTGDFDSGLEWLVEPHKNLLWTSRKVFLPGKLTHTVKDLPVPSCSSESLDEDVLLRRQSGFYLSLQGEKPGKLRCIDLGLLQSRFT